MRVYDLIAKSVMAVRTAVRSWSRSSMAMSAEK